MNTKNNVIERIVRGDIYGLKVTVMGLGLHGGGISSARFFALRGADVTVTDLQTEERLESSLKELEGIPIRYVLGKHEEEDFLKADLIIKNPAVPRSSPILKLASTVETDVSIFLRLNREPVIAVTGSKGKSTVSSAIHHVLKRIYPQARLGGNITVSPLTFFKEPFKRESSHYSESTSIREEAVSPTGSPGTTCRPTVLELSSWQLGDLAGKGVLKPYIAIITNILPDHQNRYPSMEEYIEDKKNIYREQDAKCATICNYDDRYGEIFAGETRARVYYFSYNPLPSGLEGGWLNEKGGIFRKRDDRGVDQIFPILPERLLLPGEHNRLNLLCAGIALAIFGVDNNTILEGLADFSGLKHRLEFVTEKNGVRFYNDSAATIPDSVVNAIKSFNSPLILITGGTDKNLRFDVLKEVAHIPKEIVLLEGSGTEKIILLLESIDRNYSGPFSSIEEAVIFAFKKAKKGDVVILSPGCASFEMFLNEFDRGEKFKEAVIGLT